MVTITNRNYSTRNHSAGNTFLLGNSGQIVTDKITFVTNFDFTSSASSKIQVTSLFTLELMDGSNWADKGFIVGGTVDLTAVINNGTPDITWTSVNHTIGDINGSVLTVTTTLDIAATGNVVGQMFPLNVGVGADSNTVLLVENSVTVAETIEIFHNLIENASTSGAASLLDGEVNRFEAIEVDAMSVDDVINLVQIGKKSGGSYISSTLKRITDVGGHKAYEATFVFCSPYKFLDSSFDEPGVLNASKSLKPYYAINCYPVANNPNSALRLTNSQYLGNFGWYNESYNQGDNDFSIDSVVLTTSTGDALSEVDFNQTTHVVATLTGALDFDDKAEIEFYLIPDISTIKNKTDRNCDLIQLANCYIENSPSTNTVQVFGTGGAEMDLDNVTLTLGAAEMVLEFDLVPNTEFTALIEAMTSDNRRYRITANVETEDGTANENNAVSLILKEGLLEKAPVNGGPFGGVSFNGFFNHSQPLTGVSSLAYAGCTEDDFVYSSLFNLEKGDTWKGLDLSIQVVNSSTGQFFDLLTRYVPFSPYVTDLDGVIHINYLENIPQFLDSTDRNKLEVKNTGVDTVTDYEVQIVWSLMASWRYWIAQNNALLDFFDTALPQNGRNSEWMRYLRLAGFEIRVKCVLVNTDDVAYYWNSSIELQDYDDTAELTTEIQYFDADGVEQTSLIQGQIMTVKATHTLDSGAWSVGDVWGWIGLRPFEAETMKRIGTVWNWTSQNSPLKPSTGETKATIAFPSPDVAVVTAVIDTTLIDASNFTAVARIESPIYPTCVSPIDYLFDAVINGSNFETDYVPVMDKFLTNGMNVSHANVCCPTCSVRIGDVLDVEIYAFGSKALVSALVGTFTGAACCYDVYTFADGCEEDYDNLFDALLLEVTGSTVTITDALPSQINTYSGTNFSKIAARIIALTTDETIRFDILSLLVFKGFKFTCIDGVKRIQKI